MSSYTDKLLLRAPSLLLSLLSLLAISCVVRAAAECLPGQRSLLLNLKDGFNFQYSEDKLPSWTPGSNCCDWEGVTCDPKSGHIIGLDLSDQFIFGNISSSLFSLTSLHTLNLAYNSFDGPFPQSGFEKLTKLTHLNLSGCGLSGQIPNGSISRLTSLICLDLSGNTIQLWNPNFQTLVRNLSHVRELHLDDVEMSYEVDWSKEFFTSLPRLQVLAINSCNVTGTLPEDFFLLRNWTSLDLSNNPMLSGFLINFPKGSPMKVLRLSQTNISGSLPDSIGNLKYLTDLQISGTEMLTGVIPSSIGKLTRLAHLELRGNNFIGTIPASIENLTQLDYLDLSDNHLNSSIPASLFSLPLLQNLYLDNNLLSGQLIDSLYISTSLAAISMNNNQLQGNIPQSFFKLPALDYLNLGSNNFSGTVHLDMSELKNLTSLDLSYNRWLSVQDMSDCYLHSCPKLQSLSLASCNLTNIPAFLKYQETIVSLDLSNNRIHGEIPKWIWTVVNLYTLHSLLNLSCNSLTSIEGLAGVSLGGTYLDLHSNMLSGPIQLPLSASYVDYSNNNFSSIIPSNISSYLLGAQSVSFANNSLTGEIPPSVCEIGDDPDVLDLSHNNLCGSIPTCLFENPFGLSALNLRGNKLQGIIPPIAACGNLKTLILSDNELEGWLPRSLANCNELTVLDVGDNHLVDSFPFWLGNVTALSILILRGNEFYGPVEIPNGHESNCTFFNIKIFDLSSNHFEGNLPLECFNSMKVMMNNSQSDPATIGFSYYTGGFYENTISVTSKGQEFTLDKILRIYTYIDLSNNRFEGSIPNMIGDLQGLHVLNFSHNALTGKIPPTIGNLMQLDSLDLSSNHLSGEIPQAMTSLTFLAYLNLSNNNLAGTIPQSNQFSTFPNTSFEGNPGLCGIPLPKQCANTNKYRTDSSCADNSSSTYVIGLALFVGLGFGVGMAAVLVLQNVPWKKQNANQ